MSQPEHDCFDKLAVGRSEVSKEVETSEDLNSFVEGPLETSEVGILLNHISIQIVQYIKLLATNLMVGMHCHK